MTTNKQTYLTAQGFTILKDKLNFLRMVRRVEVAEYLHETADGGDSIDNTEYIAALYEQLLLEKQISDLQNLLVDVHIIELGTADGRVRLGSTVIIQDDKRNVETFTLVGTHETNPTLGLISDESPLGKALLNHPVGDDIEVQTPDGIRIYKIASIS